MAFAFIDIPGRPKKPRSTGVTMVIDRSLGTSNTNELIEISGEYIDIVKFGWGTARLLSETVLARKIEALKNANIFACPGGTFLEIAFDQGRVDQFFRYARDIGFAAIEVSNGINPDITAKTKRDLILQAKSIGFTVFSEVGKKIEVEDKHLNVQDRINEITMDLSAGAFKVIMEARESGTLGIFDSEGRVNSQMAYDLFQRVDPDTIIWEAPQRTQQVWLLQNLGSDVNVGNIAPEDALALETLRLGLRADTMRDHRKAALITYLELGVGGALRAQRRGDIVIVVDALRASATIIEALVQGARSVIPVVSADELIGEVTAGERGGQKLPNADISNSPLELGKIALREKQLVISTTNGTECIRAAKGDNSIVLIGTVTNCAAVAAVAKNLVEKTGKRITLLAAGRNNLPAIEDRIGVTAILDNLGSPIIRGILEPYFSDNFEQDFLTSDSGRNLVSLGYTDDVIFCAGTNRTDVVPYYDGIIIKRYSSDILI